MCYQTLDPTVSCTVLQQHTHTNANTRALSLVKPLFFPLKIRSVCISEQSYFQCSASGVHTNTCTHASQKLWLL